MQLGLYKLTRELDKNEDWIGIVDLSIQIGEKKLLVVLGVKYSSLLNNKVLKHEDVEVLQLALLEHSNAKTVYEVLKKSEKRIGKFFQFCSDSGGDIIGGINLYQQESFQKKGKVIPYVPDIAHKLANLLKSQISTLDLWESFITEAAQTKLKLQLTEWADLCPPNQRSKSRFMNLDVLTEWGKKILKYFHEAEKLPNYKKFIENFGWIKKYKNLIEEISELTLIAGITRHKCRTEGIHSSTANELEKQFIELPTGQRANQFSGEIIDFIKKISKEIPKDRILLASSEVLESLFGKLKNIMDEHSKKGFGVFSLAIAACAGKIDKEIISEALKSINSRKVEEWTNENIGTTLRMRGRLRNQKKIKIIGKIEQEFTGIFEEKTSFG